MQIDTFLDFIRKNQYGLLFILCDTRTSLYDISKIQVFNMIFNYHLISINIQRFEFCQNFTEQLFAQSFDTNVVVTLLKLITKIR